MCALLSTANGDFMTNSNEDPLSLVKGHLQRDDLRKAMSTAKRLSVDVESYRSELVSCFERLNAQQRTVSILGSLKKYGNYAGISVRDLLLRVFAQRDWANFVKYTHRFFLYDGLEDQVQVALGHIDDKNGRRWRQRFEKLVEQRLVRGAVGVVPQLEVTVDDDDDKDDAGDAERCGPEPTKLVLRSIGPRALKGDLISEEADGGDPYIVSQAARAKRERANRVHAEVVHLLSATLRERGLHPLENRLVDTYCESQLGLALFEVKSVTGSNERSQVRHAISQLYEYRFLFDIPTASLWVVLSGPLESEWLVEYLLRDRSIGVLWAHEGHLIGPSLDEFRLLAPTVPSQY
jgi:hypothetical protein